MKDFTYYNPTRIVFGRGAETRAGEFAAGYGKKVLLHYGGGSIKGNGIYDRVMASLGEAGLSVVELGGVQPNPRYSLVQEGIALCRREGVELVLAVGGGSTIDSAKAIAAGACYTGEDFWQCFSGKPVTLADALPVGTVLTIPAAGSEASSDSVITNEDGWFKRSLKSEKIFPRFSLVNPELYYTLPPYQTACGSADIMSHLMEQYFTSVPNVDATDRMIEALLRTVLHCAPKALAQPQNYDVWAEISWAGTLAQSSLLGKGRIGDWASHRIEHELGGLYDIAHGAGLAIVTPAWMRFVYQKHLPRFVQFATRVMDVDLAAEHQEAIALEGIARLENFFRSLGLPVRLSQAGIGGDRLREMAEKARSVGSLETLGPDEIEAILQAAL